MFKIIILILIVILCSFIGYLYGEGFKQRYLELTELMRSLIDMENEILYSYKPVPEVLAGISNKSQGVISDLFADVSELLMKGEMENVNRAFAYSLKNKNNQMAMTQEDCNIILDLSKSLGDTDISGQGQIFSLAKEKLDRVIDIAEKDYRNNCKVYKSLGIGIGIMIAIFLI
ncbi:MAG: stage III sporulation protein SpoIIIAB [Sarcina sp.]